MKTRLFLSLFFLVSLCCSAPSQRTLDNAKLGGAVDFSAATNKPTIRLDLGLGTASSPTFAGLTLTGMLTAGSIDTQTFTGDVTFDGDVAGGSGTFNNLFLGIASTTDGNLILRRAANAFTTTIKTGVTGASYTLTLPTTDGVANEFLQTNGSGVLTWAAGGGAGLTVGTTPITGGAVGQLLYQGTGNVLGGLTAGATTQILVGGGVGAEPVWTTATGTGAPLRSNAPAITGAPTFSGFPVSIGASFTTGGVFVTGGAVTIDAGFSTSGAFTANGPTSITGGGTIVLGGFTLTVPATGTAVTTTTLNNTTLPGAFTSLAANSTVTFIGTTFIPNDLRTGNAPGNSYANFRTAVDATYPSIALYNAANAQVSLTVEAANVLQIGMDAATGTNQKLKAMDASAGTGGNLTLAAGSGTTAGGALLFQTAITGTPVDVGKFDNSTTAGDTRFFLYDVDNATLERVTVGAADSGGAGFKVLRIPN